MLFKRGSEINVYLSYGGVTYGYHWNRREPLNVGQNPMTLNEQEERSFCACAEGHLIIDEINFRHVYVSWRMRSNNDPPAHMR